MGVIKAELVVQKLEVQGRLIHTLQKPTKNSKKVMSGVTSLIFRLDFPTSFEYTLSDTAIDENISSLYGGFGLLISTQTSNSSTMGLISPTRFCFIKLFDFPPDYQSLYIKKPQRSRRHYTHCKFLHEAHYIMNIRHPFVILRSLLLLEYSLITITVTLIF